MTNDIDWARLGRYFAGECTPAEAEEVRRWVEADPERARLVGELRAAWDAAATPVTDWDTPTAWNRLAARLRTRDRRPILTLVRGDQVAGRPGPRRPIRLIALAAAALIAVVAGAWWAGTSSRSGAEIATAPPLREVRVPMGQRAQFQLIDGTRVLLGPGSVLRYDTTRFGESSRELQLDGQAHFTVAHDPRRPFLVRSVRSVTEDLGTEFAITDYAADTAALVVVASGRVAVRSAMVEPARAPTLLRGGDLVHLDPDGGASVQRGVDLRTTLAWTEGRLVFSDTPVGDVVTRINRWYGGDVRLGDPGLAGLRFTASYGAASEATVVRELATAIGARVVRRDGITVIVPLSDHIREK